MITTQVHLTPEDMENLAEKLAYLIVGKMATITSQPKEQEIYSVREVAGILKVNESTIRQYLHKGKLQYLQTDKKYLIPKSSLDEYLKRNGQQ